MTKQDLLQEYKVNILKSIQAPLSQNKGEKKLYGNSVDKIRPLFVVKTLNKMRREHSQSDKAYLQPKQNTKHRTTAHIIPDDLPLKSGTRQG